MKKWILSLSLLVAQAAVAGNTINDVLVSQLQNSIMSQLEINRLDVKKGDQANYKVDMSILQGTMVMQVLDITNEGVWIQQLVDLSFAGKQDIRVLIDPNTGEIKKMLVNGKEQQPPKTDMEVIESREEQITVPAGTFQCLYLKVLEKNENKESQQWVAPKKVPVSGMVKSMSQAQFGPVTIELTSFRKQ